MKSLLIIFIDSVLHFFSLESNPIERCRKQRQAKTDLENMTQDWYNVGNDIRRAYENISPADNVQHVQLQHHYSGPLPHPETLAKYDQIVPGAAERIITMAEKNGASTRYRKCNDQECHSYDLFRYHICFLIGIGSLRVSTLCLV